VERVIEEFGEFSRGGNIISKSGNGDGSTSHFDILPLSNKLDKEVSLESFMEHLREEIEIRNKGSLQDNRDIRSVEQFNRVGSSVTSDFHVFDGEFNSESLEIDNNEEN